MRGRSPKEAAPPLGSRRIGIFDSGHGGLTILRAVLDRLPQRRFLYFGDHANAPYGKRTQEEIYALTLRNVEWLFKQGCALVLLACNTAAAVALRRLQQEWLPGAYPARRVLGVLVPTVEAVTNVPWHVKNPPPDGAKNAETVAIFATRPTVDSNAYVREIALRAPSIRVLQQACPNLVAAIEASSSEEKVGALVAGYVAQLGEQLSGRDPDTAILGCTHYPLAAWAFADALPRSVRLLDQPALVATSLADYLDRHREFPPPDPATTNAYVTTGDAARASAMGRRFLGRTIAFEPLEPALTRARKSG